ncbi:MAG: tetraacyldisaccharide 4'-kinase [Verrucomicrobia bacterium]|nr:tetraacyldisaccharide 4'-kinase [Verrucomicrobiota bacterium]
MVLRQKILEKILLPSLRICSPLYQLGLWVRHFAYDRGIFRTTRLSVPVVSVGNLAMGGTGKTPLVHLLANTLKEKMRLAILTRGYRSQIERSRGIKKIPADLSAKECGDEPLFLARKTGVPVWVGIDRIESGKRAIAEGAECLLLDDGMQHRRLKRDLEIVLIHADNPFGLLRDSPARLKYADCIVLNPIQDAAQFEKLKKNLSKYTHAPVVGVRAEVVDKEKFVPGKVGLFCGIGNPHQFVRTVQGLNQEIVETLFLPDHGAIEEEELDRFVEKCRDKGADMVVCTEKDYVKLSYHPHVIPIAIELKIVEGKEHWDALLTTLLNKVHS